MSENGTEFEAIPVEQFSDPVCGYVTEGHNRVVQTTNEPFETAFGAVPGGTTLTDAADILGLDVVTGNSFGDALDSDGQCIVERSDPGGARTQYLVRPTAQTADGERFLVFVERETSTANEGVPETVDIDHIATIISHDLRNPLDVAKSRLEAGRDLDEDEHFEHVEWAHERMERIIEDVLTLARTDIDPDRDEPVDLGAAARTAWRTVETDGSSLVVEEPLSDAVADEDRVVRLFENLFRNAVEHGSTAQSDDASARGAPSTDEAVNQNEESPVTVTVGPLTDESTTGFYVADDGPGIPPAERHRVFEPGYSRDGDGTGLGLSIVARIASLHGWSIDVERGTDGGARFEITGLDRPEN